MKPQSKRIVYYINTNVTPHEQLEPSQTPSLELKKLKQREIDLCEEKEEKNVETMEERHEQEKSQSLSSSIYLQSKTPSPNPIPISHSLPFHFQSRFMIRLLSSNLHSILSQNNSVITCYQSLIHLFTHHLKQHQQLSDQIESILKLSTDQIQKLMVERYTDRKKLESIKLKLEDFMLSRDGQYSLNQFKGTLDYFQVKNRELIDMMAEFNTKPINDFFFSRRLFKHLYPSPLQDTLFLDHNKRILNKLQLKSTQINLVQPPIDITSIQPSFNKIIFKINNMPKKFLYLGAIKLSTILKAEDVYEFDRKLGNGAYVIAGHSGYSFSDDYEQENFQPTGFKFGTGDRVEVEYRVEEGVIRFWNRGRQEEARLRVKRGEDVKSLHFCMMSLNQMTEVEILDQREQ